MRIGPSHAYSIGNDNKLEETDAKRSELLNLKPSSLRYPKTGSYEVESKIEASPKDDTCLGKDDQYYPNYSSNCTSYYFCTAGFQMTFLCDPGLKFNGQKCTPDYKCPIDSSAPNPCANRENGYYGREENSHQYYYCYQRAKVIELTCSDNKIYDSTLKKCLNSNEVADVATMKESWEASTCIGKGNGFYPDLESGCSKYYYCIRQVKTDLECPQAQVFNGDICVKESRFKCPKKSRLLMKD